MTKEHKPISWNFPEYIKHSRKRGWYIWSSLIALLIIVYSLLVTNYLFALLVVMFGIILIINHRQDPQKINFTIDHDGIHLDKKLYKYKDIDKFWVIYQPPHAKNLYFEFKTSIRPKLSIPLDKQDPLEIKSFLRQYLEEDLEQEEESLTDIFGRIFKL